jgi:3D (Asp-Asp-Asp) domain-containing protein
MSRFLMISGLVSLVVCAEARADVAFALQPAIGVSTSVQPIDTTVASTPSSTLPRESFTMVPSLRLGIDLSSMMILAYGSNSNTGVQGHTVSGVTRGGLVVEPVLWRSSDARVGIYLLGGAGAVAMAGATITTDQMMTKASSFVATGFSFQLGVGGWFAVHPNFAVGFELAVQPDIISLDSGLYIGDEAVVSFTGTFVAGDRSFPRDH